MLKLLSQFECDRAWRTISGSPIWLTDQNSCIWNHMHLLVFGCDRGKKQDLWCWLRWRPHCEDAQSPGRQGMVLLHWEPQLLAVGNRQMQMQGEVKWGWEGGRHTWSHRGSHTCSRHSTGEWAVCQVEEKGLENYHMKILNSGSGNSIPFVGCVTRKAAHTLEAS